MLSTSRSGGLAFGATSIFVVLLAAFWYVSRKKQLRCFRARDIEGQQQEMRHVHTIVTTDLSRKREMGRDEVDGVSIATSHEYRQFMSGGGDLHYAGSLHDMPHNILHDAVPPDSYYMPPGLTIPQQAYLPQVRN